MKLTLEDNQFEVKVQSQACYFVHDCATVQSNNTTDRAHTNLKVPYFNHPSFKVSEMLHRFNCMNMINNVPLSAY